MRPRPVVGKATVPEAVRRLLDKFDYPDRESPPQVVPILPTLGASSAGFGAFIHLSRNATQSIGTVAEAIEWDTLPAALGFAEFSETVPTMTVTIPQAGYYNVAVQLGWSSFTDGGTLIVVRTRGGVDVTVWPPADDPGLWSTTNGQLFEGTAHAIECQAGDLLAVILDADDASAQTLASATCAVYLVDRAGLPSAYAELVLDDGPLAYWRLDEQSGTNAADIAGHASGPFDGTYTNTPTLAAAGVMQDGSGSPSVQFARASSERVDGSDWAAMEFAGTAAFSLEAWCYLDSLPGAGNFAIVIDKQVAAGGNGWELVVDNNVFRFSRSDGTQDDTTSSTLSIDTIYHVVATYDGTTMILYVNGVSVDTQASSRSVGATAELVSIGWDSASSDHAWDGRLDEVAVYDRALTPAETAEHYAVGTRG